MKALLSLALGLLISTAAMAEQAADSSRPEDPVQCKTMRIKRTTLLVHDLQRSIDFYTEVMGLELYDAEYEYNTEPDSYGYPLFNIPKGARKRMALFNTSDEVRGFAIEEVVDFEWQVQQAPRTAVALFETDDIRGLEARLREGGYTVFTPAAGAAYGTQFIEIGFLDPDGHLLAAYQYNAE
jgi:catechol 2,3-dioxygenase-like lactoylglutathione lyase family enzyme